MTGRFLYHQVIPLVGGPPQLVPLSELKALDPVAWEAAMTKYESVPSRQRLAETFIPMLGRKWTQVVFLSTVHPHAIWSAWREVSGRELPSASFWEIPAASIDAERAVVFGRTITASGERAGA